MVKCPGCGEENPPKFRLCGYCGTPLAAQAPPPPHEVRKTVTVIFSDLKGSTELGERLDAEALHEVKERYFGAMAAEIRRHGGKIEKYIGDAIMAVFGLPRAHEDDALRAVRAAAGMQAALAKTNDELRRHYGVALGNRTGVNTGEVVANVDPGADQKLATGDAVNVAARLEQAAPVNEIYLGETTYRLVSDAVQAEPVESLELKGKSERVAAWRLVSVQGFDGRLRRVDTPVVGRDAELAALDQAFAAAVEHRRARMVTVIGDAGAGKSRLVAEAVARLEAQARVVRGRCLPYGDGITFWPLVTILRQAAAIRDDDTPEQAVARVLELVGDAAIAERLAAATGLSRATFPLQELTWAARRLLEGLAAVQPLVVVVDDIHWAETVFLELLEQVLDTTADAPMLLLATSRHDLLDEHPQWGDREGSARLVLKPLSAADSAQVIANLLGAVELPAPTIARIVEAAEGNPLYVEQMLAMLLDGAGRAAGAAQRIDVPPTIQALLEARLDQLSRGERELVEPASVIGLEFARPAVQALRPASDGAALGTHLSTLTQKRFIRPFPERLGEEVYRFHHHLVRETVYGALLKRARATLHIEFVRWADRINAERGRGLEYQEILGYHLEQAHRYLSELGPLDDAGRAVGADAATRLGDAGRRAFARGDMQAAANLIERATRLRPRLDAARLALLPALGEAQMELGDFAAARRVLDEAEAAGAEAGDAALQASARLLSMFVRLYSGEQEGWAEAALRVAHEAIPLLEAAGARDALASAWRLVGLVHGVAGRYAAAGAATTHYRANARAAGNERLVARSALGLAMNALFGPLPVPEAIAQCEAALAEGIGDRGSAAVVQCVVAQLKAMNGEFDAARALIGAARATLRELGQGVTAASTGIDLARVELLGGDLQGAERELRADHRFLATKGETYFLATLGALLARIVLAQQRDAEALELLDAAERVAAADDHDAQALCRSLRAPLVARAGDLARAEALAREAVELAGRTEAPILQADTRVELARVLLLAGDRGAALQAIDEAGALYRAKGDVVSAARLDTWAGEL